MKTLKKTLIILLIGILLLIFLSNADNIPIFKYLFILLIPIIIYYFIKDTGIINALKNINKKQTENEFVKRPVKPYVFILIALGVGIYFFGLGKKSPSNSSNHNSQNIQNNQPCSDMESYNQGLSEGRTQKGILTDCDTYYPYAGWATNKECWCEGFNKGKNE